MQKYIQIFFSQYGAQEYKWADNIYDTQVLPRLSSTETSDTRALDTNFNSDQNFSSATQFCMKVRRKVKDFLDEKMINESSDTKIRAHLWRARVEEIVFIKELCLKASSDENDTYLALFIDSLKDLGQTAFLSKFNKLIEDLKEISAERKTGVLQAELRATDDQLTRDKKSLQSQVTTLSGEKQTLQQQVLTLTAGNKGLQGQITTLTGQNTTLKQQFAQLQQEISSRDVKIQEQDQKAQTLQAQVDIDRQTQQKLLQTVSVQQGQIDQLVQQLSRIQSFVEENGRRSSDKEKKKEGFFHK